VARLEIEHRHAVDVLGRDHRRQLFGRAAVDLDGMLSEMRPQHLQGSQVDTDIGAEFDAIGDVAGVAQHALEQRDVRGEMTVGGISADIFGAEFAGPEFLLRGRESARRLHCSIAVRCSTTASCWSSARPG
jgi:hypothetical protein